MVTKAKVQYTCTVTKSPNILLQVKQGQGSIYLNCVSSEIQHQVQM